MSPEVVALVPRIEQHARGNRPTMTRSEWALLAAYLRHQVKAQAPQAPVQGKECGT